MSLILDALNRSESERRGEGDVPGLATEHFIGSEANSGTMKLRRWALILVAVVVAVAASWWILMPSAQTPDAVAVPAVSKPEVPIPDVLISEAPKTAAPETGQFSPGGVPISDDSLNTAQPASVVTTPVQEIRDPRPGPDPDAAADVAALYANAGASVEETEAMSAPEVTLSVAEQEQATVEETPVQQQAGPRGETIDIEQVLSQAQSELANARLQEHPAPFLDDLSQQRKDQIPTIMYSVHDYSGKSGESSVVLNGQTAREGTGIGGGITVVEILPDSAVLKHQGQQFRLRALNSWVNL